MYKLLSLIVLLPRSCFSPLAKRERKSVTLVRMLAFDR